MSIEFLLTTLIIVASPGTGVVYTLAAGLSRGGRASVLAAFACTLGIVPHLIAALTGLAALLHASALLFELVKYAGVAYLLYMAWATLRQHGAMKIDAKPDARNARQVLVDGILINLLNPKLSIFFVAFLPQFIAPSEPHVLLRMLELSGRVHGRDLHHLRHLWHVRCRNARQGCGKPKRDGMDAPLFRRCLPCTRRKTGADRAVRFVASGKRRMPQTLVTVSTKGPGLYEITDQAAEFVRQSTVETGLLTLFVRHTSCSLLIQENADPDVRSDLEAFFRHLVPPADDPSMDYLRAPPRRTGRHAGPHQGGAHGRLLVHSGNGTPARARNMAGHLPV